jgi:radical SAM protein with 4Fe4S-binding SPASM domain
LTSSTDRDLAECERKDIDEVVAKGHQVNRTVFSKPDSIKSVKWIWKTLFPEKDERGRPDDTLVPYPVRHVSCRIDKSKERRRNEKLSMEEYERLRVLHREVSEPKVNREVRPSSCGVCRNMKAVTPEGDAYPCHRYVGMDEFKLGNVLGAERPDRENERRYYEKIYKVFDSACAPCWLRHLCGGQCPWYLSRADGTLVDPDKPGQAHMRRYPPELRTTSRIVGDDDSSSPESSRENLGVINRRAIVWSVLVLGVGLGVGFVVPWRSGEGEGDAGIVESRIDDSSESNQRPRSRVGEHVPVRYPAKIREDTRAGAESDANPIDRLSIRARCVHADGRPIAGMKMRAALVRGASEALSDATGDVRLEFVWSPAIIEGNRLQMYVEFHAPGYALVTRQDHFEAGVRELDLGVVVVGAGASATGRVVDRQGNGVAGAFVFAVHAGATLLAIESRVWGTGIRRLASHRLLVTQSDSEGRYAIPGIPVGTCAFAARKTGFEWGLSKEVDIPGITSVPDMTLARLAPACRVEGDLLDEAGNAVEGADVYLLVNRARANSDRLATTRTGPTGRFELPAAPDRLYTVRVDARKVLSRSVNSTDLTTHDVRPGRGGIRLRLGGVRGLSIRVLNMLRVPVPDATVLMLDKNDDVLGEAPQVVREGLSILMLPKSAASLRISAASYKATGYSLQNLGYTDDVVEVFLARTTSIFGYVRFDGVGLGNAWVHAHPVETGMNRLHAFVNRLDSRLPGGISSNNVRRAKTRADGMFELQMPVPGRYVLHAIGNAYGRGESHEFVVRKSSHPMHIDMRLQKPGSLHGTVRIPPELETWSGFVGISAGDGHLLTQTVGVHKRSFAFENLAPGGWQVRLFRVQHKEWLDRQLTSPNGAAFWKEDVTIRSGHRASWDLDYRGILKGRIVDSVWGGAGWRLVSISRDGRQVAGSVNSEGGFRIGPVRLVPAKVYLSKQANRGVRVLVWRNVDFAPHMVDEFIEVRGTKAMVRGLSRGGEYSITGHAGSWNWSIRFVANNSTVRIAVPAGSIELRSKLGSSVAPHDKWRSVGRALAVQGSTCDLTNTSR